MKVYTTDKIRNIALLGHGGSGKTSLVEAMANLSGLTTRLGTIDDGNTISDYDKEEQKRKFSISTSLIPIEWEDTKLNIMDTPGFFDFVGEVEEAATAAASAIIVGNGKSGVETGTKKAWDLCDKSNIPRMIYVSTMDIDNSSFNGNNATNGGGVISNGNNTVINNTQFTNNTAEFGGAISWYGEKGNITNNCNFTSNSADENGGAIFWDGSEGSISDNCLFIYNKYILSFEKKCMLSL